MPRKALFLAGAASIALVLCCGIGFGMSSAWGGSPDETGTFGIGEKTSTISNHVDYIDNPDQITSSSIHETNVLSQPTTRNITASVDGITQRREEARIAEEERHRAEEQLRIEKAQENRAELQASYGLPPLSDVDWTVGRDAFIEEWTSRIDSYLSGTALDGCGIYFATAAWENGIDPRWSPAISNTESGNGAVCFLPHNAWGWGSSSWSSWEEAINAHVAGLAKGYGYSLTMSFAQIYCPPQSAYWYSNTLSQMQLM